MLGLGAGISEHQALVACALVLVARRVDALCNISRLAVHLHQDLGILPVEIVLVIANVADRFPSQLFHQRMVYAFRPARFTGNADKVGSHQRFDATADEIRLVGREIGIDDRV